MREKRQWREWTPDEDRLMLELYCQPEGPEEIARRTGRTMAAVVFRAHVLRQNRRRYRRNPRFMAETPAPRGELLESLKCPGLNGHGCGNRLWEELVPSGCGYIAPGEIDLVCVAGHRFRAT
jgi:hypothetical protein